MQSLRPMASDLLRGCLRRSRNDNELRALAAEADWHAALDLAQTHGMIPLLYRSVADVAPESVNRSLATAYIANAAHNLKLTGELLRLLSLFEANGIEVVPFKGPVLADILFGNISLRQFADLDILVRERDLSRARRLLAIDGYNPEFSLEGKSEADYIRSEHAFQYQKPDAGFVVELHWRFGSQNQAFPISPEEIWTRLERRTFQGRTILSLSREDLLLYLCVHGAKHAWDRLEWIACIGQLVRVSPSLDWDAVESRAIASGAATALHLALRLVAEFCDLDVPTRISHSVAADKSAHRLASQAIERLFLSAQQHTQRELYRHAFYLRTRERLRDRARIVLHSSIRVPHPYARDWQLFRVPASLSFLYYLLRPMRLMSELGFRRLKDMLRADTAL